MEWRRDMVTSTAGVGGLPFFPMAFVAGWFLVEASPEIGAVTLDAKLERQAIVHSVFHAVFVVRMLDGAAILPVLLGMAREAGRRSEGAAVEVDAMASAAILIGKAIIRGMIDPAQLLGMSVLAAIGTVP